MQVQKSIYYLLSTSKSWNSRVTNHKKVLRAHLEGEREGKITGSSFSYKDEISAPER